MNLRKTAFVLAAAFAAAPCLFAADAPPKPATPPTPVLIFVPRTAVEAAQRFMTLTPEQAKKLQEIQKAQAIERQDAMDQLDKQLDAKYQPQAAAALDDTQKAVFDQISAAMSEYWTAVNAADRAFRDVWEKGVGEKCPVIGFYYNNVIYLATFLSGIDDAQKAALRKLQMDYSRENFDARNAAIQDSGLEPPAPGDPAAWQEYQRKVAAIQADVDKKLTAAYIEKAKAALGDTPAAKKFDAIAKALVEREAKRKQATDALAEKLKTLVPPEKFAPSFTQPRGAG